MLGVRRAAIGMPAASTGDHVERLVALRRLLRRLLGTVGGLVALVTAQTGAFIALEGSVHAPGRPPQTALVFGGFGSLLVALTYVPGWAALRGCGQDVCERLFPMKGLDKPSDILSTAADRGALERALGVDTGLLADLQSGMAILAPLFAGALAAFLPL